MSEESDVASLCHQQVALLATANGTHIAVQVPHSSCHVPPPPTGFSTCPLALLRLLLLLSSQTPCV